MTPAELDELTVRLENFASMRERCMLAEAALRKLAEFVRLQDPRNSTERYELIADAFTKETGHVAPGRSMPPAMAYLPDDDDRRHVLWRGFCNRWHEAAYDTALAAAREVIDV